MQPCHSQCVPMAALRGRCCLCIFLHSCWDHFWQQGRFMLYITVRRQCMLVTEHTESYIHLLLHLLMPDIYVRASVFSMFFPYTEAIYDYCGGNLTVTGVKATAGIFATYPAPYLSLLAGFIDQVAMKLDLRIHTNHYPVSCTV